MSDPRERRHAIILRLLLGLIAIALLFLVFNKDHGIPFDPANRDFARLVALVAILIFVGAGVLGRQLGALEILRSMAVWAAIILVVAGLYASRDQLAGFAGRLLGALVPGVPVTGRLAGDSNPDTVMVTRASDGHFAIRTSVNAVPLTMLVDTGASFVTLTYDDAIKAGIDASSLDYVVPIRTASGMMIAAAITIARLDVGMIERRDVQALVAPRGSLYQSLLGMTFLDTLNGYAISGDRLVLTP